MDNKDIRWQQRFSNYKKALAQLQKFIDKGKLNELEEQGLIKSFEYTYELAWNTIKDFYEGQGETGIQGSRDAFRLAIGRGLVQNGDNWMKMIEGRIRTSHTYDEEVANEIASDIFDIYHPLFIQLQTTLDVEQQNP